MKIQDLVFIVILAVIILLKRWRWLWWAGVVCLVGAIPLFVTWTFFTGQRLVWYAILFWSVFIVVSSAKVYLKREKG